MWFECGVSVVRVRQALVAVTVTVAVVSVCVGVLLAIVS